MWNWLGIPVCDALTALKIAVINAKKPGYPCWMSNESIWFQGKCTLFYSCFGNCRGLAYKTLAYEVCIICPKLIAACKIHCGSPNRRPDGRSTLDWSTVHEANLSAYKNQHMCGAMWDVEECIRLCFCMSHKYFKDAKAMRINRILKLS